MKRKNFLLIEVLIALFLITISAIPIVQIPYNMLKKQINFLEQIELERIADNTFYQISKDLYNQQPSFFSDLPLTKKEAIKKTLDSTYLTIDNFYKKSVAREYRIWKKEKQKGNKTYYLTKVSISLLPSKSTESFQFDRWLLISSEKEVSIQKKSF